MNSAIKGKYIFSFKSAFRLECYNACNKAFFPMLKCQQLDTNFYYNHNLYERLYTFEKPDPTIWGNEALEQYKTCKGYVQNNAGYPIARSDEGLGR
jgi:hypothetical protein